MGDSRSVDIPRANTFTAGGVFDNNAAIPDEGEEIAVGISQKTIDFTVRLVPRYHCSSL